MKKNTKAIRALIGQLLLSCRVRFRRALRLVLSDAVAAKLRRCGPGLHIHPPFDISGNQMMEVGTNVHINSQSFIRASGGLIIGNNVHIGPRLTIYTVNHVYESSALPYDESIVKKPVVIGDNVWIGACVTIVPGVSIGEGAIIAAGSVVAKNVPKLAVVGGVGCRVLKMREEKRYQRLKNEGRFGGPSGKLFCVDRSKTTQSQKYGNNENEGTR